MSSRLRSLIASIVMLVFLAVYIWLATLIGGLLPPKPWFTLPYYAVVGTAWGVPLIPLLSWINKGSKPR
jgi:hypothetical protein